MSKGLSEIEETLESLIDQPFMAITNGPPSYTIDYENGPDGYEQVVVWLQIDNVRQEIIAAFNNDYDSLAKPFSEWAKSKDFVDSQILSDEGTALTFEITAISPDEPIV